MPSKAKRKGSPFVRTTPPPGIKIGTGTKPTPKFGTINTGSSRGATTLPDTAMKRPTQSKAVNIRRYKAVKAAQKRKSPSKY